MGLTAEQEVRIRTYFETTYNLYFGVPTERSNDSLTPNEHVMLLQYLQLYLLNYPREPLDEALLNKRINEDTVNDVLEDFMNSKHSPLNPDVYFHYQTNFNHCGDKKNPATSTDVIAHLIKITEIISQQLGHGYLKQENDPQKSPFSLTPLVKLGIFGSLALGAGFIISSLTEKNSPSDLMPK